MKRYVLFLLVLVLLLVSSAKAGDVYVAQSPAGLSNGTSCSNASTASLFNSWTPGLVLRLCGQFLGVPGQRLITVQGSGTAVAPITIKFEPGAVLTAPYWNQFGAINIAGRSYIIIDGAGVGIIQNTANGTGLKYQQMSNAVYAYQCNNCTVKNLNISNLYVHTSVTDLALVQASGVTCIYFAYANNFTIDHNVCHDAGWAFAGGGNNLLVTNNEVYRADHGVGFGVSGIMVNPQFIGNYFHDWANWDSSDNRYHHDGIHIWGIGAGNAISGVKILNNTFDGDPGANTTAHIFLQDAVFGSLVAGNRHHVPKNNSILPIEIAWWSQPIETQPSGNVVDHNVIVIDNGRGAGITALGQLKFSVTNNIIFGGVWNVGFTNSTLGTVDNNTYEDLLKDTNGLNAWGLNGHSYHDLLSWQTACGCDKNSKIVSLK